jgi:hypothetical protein
MKYYILYKLSSEKYNGNILIIYDVKKMRPTKFYQITLLLLPSCRLYIQYDLLNFLNLIVRKYEIVEMEHKKYV